MTPTPGKTGGLAHVLKNGAMYLKLLMRRDTPWRVKAVLIVALVYLFSPYDLIPDWLLGFGIIDDFVVVSLLVGLAIKLLNKEMEKKQD